VTTGGQARVREHQEALIDEGTSYVQLDAPFRTARAGFDLLFSTTTMPAVL
jgi:hypothetical protein